jgi:hypothetical protein
MERLKLVEIPFTNLDLGFYRIRLCIELREAFDYIRFVQYNGNFPYTYDEDTDRIFIEYRDIVKYDYNLKSLKRYDILFTKRIIPVPIIKEYNKDINSTYIIVNFLRGLLNIDINKFFNRKIKIIEMEN